MFKDQFEGMNFFCVSAAEVKRGLSKIDNVQFLKKGNR